MVKIRLTRMGKKHSPHYRIIAIKAREKRESKAIEYLGFYNPISKQYKIEKERVKYWLGVGAQPTDTVAYLLSKEGIIKIQKKKYNKKPGKKRQERMKKEDNHDNKTPSDKEKESETKASEGDNKKKDEQDNGAEDNNKKQE